MTDDVVESDLTINVNPGATLIDMTNKLNCRGTMVGVCERAEATYRGIDVEVKPPLYDGLLYPLAVGSVPSRFAAPFPVVEQATDLIRGTPRVFLAGAEPVHSTRLILTTHAVVTSVRALRLFVLIAQSAAAICVVFTRTRKTPFPHIAQQKTPLAVKSVGSRLVGSTRPIRNRPIGGRALHSRGVRISSVGSRNTKPIFQLHGQIR